MSTTNIMKVISLLKEQKYYTTILLCLIIFIAAFLRLYSLSTPAFSSDDIKSLETFEKVGVGNIIKDAINRSQPPFYFVILHYWTLMAGFSEFSLRLPTAIFGVLSVFVLFKLASLIFDNKTALIGALLIAVNPEHFFLSFMLKQYTLTVLLALVSVYLLLKALKERRTIYWIAFGISNIALFCTHYSATLVVLTEIIYMTIVYRKYKYTIQIFSAIAVICLLVVTLFFLQKWYSLIPPASFRWIGSPTLEAFLNVLSSFIAGFCIKIPEEGIIFADNIYFKNQGPYIDALPMPAKIGIFVFFSFFLLLGIFEYLVGPLFQKQEQTPFPPFNKGGLGEFKPLIYIWATVPILSNYAISFLFFSTIGPTRYQLFWSCSILLLIARGFASIGRRRFIYPILFIAICIYLLPILTKESNPRMLNWKGVANYLREMVSDRETIHFLSNEWASLPLKYYYKEDLYIGTGTVFKEITPEVDGEGPKGIFLIEVGNERLPVETSKSFDIMTESLNMFYASKDVKQFYNIKVTHYWEPRKTISD